MAKKLVKKSLRRRRAGNRGRLLTPNLVDAIRRELINSTQRPTFIRICNIFDLSETTFYRWLKENKDLREAVEEAKAIGRQRLAELAEGSLGRLVKGIRWKEETKEADKDGNLKLVKTVTRFIPPNERAVEFALKNIEPERWKDRQEVEHSGGIVVQVVSYADTVATQLQPAALPNPATEGD